MRKHLILVADPSPAVRKLLSIVFGQASYELSFAVDGEETLGRAIVDPPELVVAELRLDRLDGAALCEQLKRHPRTRSARVLFLTTSTSEWDYRRARRAGADGYLTKPFSPRILLRKVDELLGSRAAELPPAPGWAAEQEDCG